MWWMLFVTGGEEHPVSITILKVKNKHFIDNV